MNRANPLPLDSKADNNKIERVRSANVSGVSVKNKVAVSRVAVSKAVSKAAVSKADDKTGSFEPISGGRQLPPLSLTSRRVAKGEIILLCQKKK